jgi:hypothetical protein
VDEFPHCSRWQRPVVHDLLHHDRRGHPLDTRQPRQPLVAQPLERRDIRCRHPDEVVRLAEQPLRGALNRRAIGWICAWTGLLAAAAALGGRVGLGALLAAASIIQVTPSLWTAYRTAHPTGISKGTWALVCGELSCWLSFGLYKSDARLITLGITGVLAGILMLARVQHAGVLSKQG